MELNVRMPTGESVAVATSPEATVGDVKQALQDIKGVSPVHQKLALGDKSLKDRTVLAEAGLANGDEVNMKVGLRGGCDCCVNLCKALLIILLFPFILLIMVFGLIVWLILFPCYCIGKVLLGHFLLLVTFISNLHHQCCCAPECCCIVCVEEHVVKKLICLPCRACSWCCEDIADA